MDKTKAKHADAASGAARPDFPGAALNPAHQQLLDWFRTVKFRHVALGGVDEVQLWKKLEELYTLYEQALAAERARYDALLSQQTGQTAVQQEKREDGHAD